jgi:hypothetical protein
MNKPDCLTECYDPEVNFVHPLLLNINSNLKTSKCGTEPYILNNNIVVEKKCDKTKDNLSHDKAILNFLIPHINMSYSNFLEINYEEGDLLMMEGSFGED